MLLAFAISLLAHLTMLGSGLVSFDTVEMPADPKLHKLTARLENMQMDEASSPALQMPDLPGTLGAAGGDASQPAAARPKPKPARKKPRPSAEQASSAPLAVASAAASAPLPEPKPAPKLAASSSKAEQPASAALAAAPADTVKPDKPIRHFPLGARVQYSLFYSGLSAGQGSMVWQRDGNNYSLVTDVVPIIGPKIHYETTGTVGKQGLKPDRFEGTRDGELRDRAYFDWSAGVLRYGDRNADKSEPLDPGAQDWLGLGVQLALRGDNMGDAPIQITTGKKVYRMLLKPEGETDFDTGDGSIRAVVVRVKQPDELYEFWLAPDFANIPIRVLRVGKDARYEMRANLIELAGKTVWKQPPRKLNNENRH
ncbi:Protein of unknown function [Vogesella sp. LIG4]|nr:Protein of unknown function [Vogesella sp. LIG4]